MSLTFGDIIRLFGKEEGLLIGEHQARVLNAAEHFAARLKDIDRELRKTKKTIPSLQTKEQVASEFRSLIAAFDRYNALHGKSHIEELKRECRAILGPWLFRSRYFNRSFHKPHGFPGDFWIIEWIYDLEGISDGEPTQPAIVNCLDYVFSTLPSVQSAWERRRYFAQLLTNEHRRKAGRLRILDVACGGSRYTRDFLSTLTDDSKVEITLLEQDAAAVEYCRTVSLSQWISQLTIHCDPVDRLCEAVAGRKFDVVISSGLFDYLDNKQAGQFLADMLAHTAAGGIIAVANFHPADPSRAVNEWLVDWPLIYRDESALSALFPKSALVETAQSQNKALAYASARQKGRRRVS